MNMAIDANAFARNRWLCLVNRISGAPMQMNPIAVTGFIATSPGTMLLRNSICSHQPARTSTPAITGSALVARDSLRNARAMRDSINSAGIGVISGIPRQGTRPVPVVVVVSALMLCGPPPICHAARGHDDDGARRRASDSAFRAVHVIERLRRR